VLEKAVLDYGTDLEDSSKALVIGNGESRCAINLNLFKHTHILFGCNALHRDLTVHHLVCCDKRMADESTINPNTKNTLIYVRDNWFHYFKKIKKNKNIRALPALPFLETTKKDHPDHWGSGAYSVFLAASLGFKEIELVGFDLYSNNNFINNVYKGTQNYSKTDAQPIDPSYWIYQLSKTFDYFSCTEFIIRNRSNWMIPKEWQKNNVKFLAL
jgi:uncharacterized Rossmann fold enzyme